VPRLSLVAPFVSSAEVDLPRLLAADGYRVRDQLAREQGRWAWHQPDEGSVLALIEDHGSTGASLLPDRLLAGTLVDVPDDLAALGVTAVEVGLGVHGLGCVVVHADVGVDPLEALSALEAAAQRVVDVAAADVRSAVAAVPGTLLEDRQRGRYPRDAFLWWHRVVWAQAEVPAWSERLCDEVPVPTATGDCRVGDGYSAVVGGDERLVAEVVRGLVRASEHWLLLETTGQALVSQVAEVLAVDDLDRAALVRAEAAGVRTVEREGLRAEVVRDELRYLTGVPRAVVLACSDCWRMPLDTVALRGQVELLRSVVGRRLDDERARSQHRLNALAFALAVVGALSLALGVFETAVGSSSDETDAVRVAVAVAVALVAGGFLLVAARTRGSGPRV
jgi:hypothetical protein